MHTELKTPDLQDTTQEGGYSVGSCEPDFGPGIPYGI